MPSQQVLDQKKALVQELTAKLQGSCTGVLVNYKGINVADDTKLRKDLREAGVDYSVVKNTMLKRAAEAADLADLAEYLQDTTAIAISNDDYTAAARILCDYSSKNDFFQVKSGFIDGDVVDADQVKALSKLPSKEQLVAQVLGGLNSPISGFACVLSGVQKGLVVALNAIAEQKSA